MENRPKNIVLLGFKASGKTVVGRTLARHLNCEFVDLDEAIEETHRRETGQNMNCRTIYLTFGGGYFREIEQRVLREVVESREGVIALGGGSLAEAPAPEMILKESFCVYLAVEPETLFNRIMAGGMPAFFNPENPRASFDELRAKRLPLYQRLANIVVDNSNRLLDDVVNQILAALQNIGLYPQKVK